MLGGNYYLPEKWPDWPAGHEEQEKQAPPIMVPGL
jgi:hypothetical protein